MGGGVPTGRRQDPLPTCQFQEVDGHMVVVQIQLEVRGGRCLFHDSEGLSEGSHQAGNEFGPGRVNWLCHAQVGYGVGPSGDAISIWGTTSDES
jgi:hypothetical protein